MNQEPTKMAEEANSTAELVVTPSPEEKKLTINKLISAVFSGYGEKANELSRNECNATISEYLTQVANEYECCKNYNVICLYDNGSIIKSDADTIYNSVTKFTNDKPLLLI